MMTLTSIARNRARARVMPPTHAITTEAQDAPSSPYNPVITTCSTLSELPRVKPGARGFSLIELMVAMAIGLILTIGVVQIFSASRSSYQLDEGLARAQENGRFAIEFLSREVRHAAHLGCRRNVSVFNNLVGANPIFQVTGVLGHEYTATATGPGSTYSIPPNPSNTIAGWTPALTTSVVPAPGALPGSDVIGIERLTPVPINIAAPTTPTTSLFVPPALASQFKAGDILMITDCMKASVFQATNVDLGTGEITHDLGGGPPGNRCGVWANNVGGGGGNAAGAACNEQVYDTNAMIGQVATVYFYVSRDPTSNRPTLYQNTISPGGASASAALVEGVENIQILYGVDDTTPQDGVPERYVAADNVPAFTRVVSIRIGVLVDSINATGTVTDQAIDTDTYNVAGTTIDPQNDKLKRRVFATTIQLRNRGI